MNSVACTIYVETMQQIKLNKKTNKIERTEEIFSDKILRFILL